MKLIDADKLKIYVDEYGWNYPGAWEDLKDYLAEVPEVSIMDAMEWIEGKKNDK